MNTEPTPEQIVEEFKSLPEAIKSDGLDAWKFACAWYSENEIRHYLDRQKANLLNPDERVPEDIYSPEFVKWMTRQYRLAMAKGMEIARRKEFR